ncbi:MAG: GNAT family N-acetyltransferase [Treponema sp.]
MIRIKRYSDSQKDEWDLFCNNSKMPLFMFNRDFMDYHKDRFTDRSLLFYDDDELAAIFPASEKETVLVSHGGLTYGGFILGAGAKQHTVNDCFTALLNYAKTNGFTKIIYKNIPHIYHKQGAEEDLYSLFVNGAKILKVEPSTVINLKNPLKMPKGRKAQISRARREGVEIKESTDFKSFMSIEEEVLEVRHGVKAVHTADELALLHSYFPENIRLFAASYQDKMIAGALIFEYENTVHTQYMAANDTARQIGALDLAISFIIDTYKETKTWLDFGISSENAGSILNEGLIAQKEGFGGRTNTYMTWEIDL